MNLAKHRQEKIRCFSVTKSAFHLQGEHFSHDITKCLQDFMHLPRIPKFLHKHLV